MIPAAEKALKVLKVLKVPGAVEAPIARVAANADDPIFP
jgi:hypothetical protein